MNLNDFICTDSITPRKIKPQNIVNRLYAREIYGAKKKPGTNFHVVREFYQSIFPNLSIANVEKPPCFLRKFSPDGKFLIAFSFDQTSLEIYKYQGCASVGDLIYNCEEEIIPEISTGRYQTIRNKIFDRLFKLKHVVNLGNNNIQLNRECSLFTNDGKYVIVGAATYIAEELRPNFYEMYTTNESIPPTMRCPIEDYWLYLVDLHNGRLSASLNFKVDKIFLSHNQGLCLFNNTLAVLSIQHQTIHIYEIFDGTFLELRKIGRFCTEEEVQLYSAVFPPNLNRPFREATINSLKHHILVYLYKRAKFKHDKFDDKLELRLFYYFFDKYKHLRMWKMQLLDDNHLLIRYASEDVVTLNAQEPNSHPSFFVIYNIWETKVLAVYDNTSEDLLYLFENFCDMFRNVQMHSETQFTCSPSNNIYAKLLQERFKLTIISAKGGGVLEATKRLLAQLPISAQSYSSSPYLDLSLFSYDDKWVSVLERPKACGEYPIRFFARDSGLLKFRIYPGFQSKPSPPTARRLVAFTFHPTEPFAISVQRIQTEYVVNFHIRHSTLQQKR